jgi:polyhydroxybutyrate depolymerase
LSELAEQKGFIVVYPNGIERRWDVTSNALIGVDDVSFVSALIDQLTKIRAIDRRRIYATGVSNGGFLVQRLACEPKSQIAAFASVVATLPGELQPFCHPETPINLLMINGTDDRKVPWEGGSPPKVPYGWILSVPDTINFWRQHNDCTAPTQVKQLPGNHIEISRYPNCRDGSEVELVTMKGVGHVWPRGGSGPNQLLNGSKEIWDFFQRHFRRVSP